MKLSSKRLLLSFGTISVVALPLISLTSCGENTSISGKLIYSKNGYMMSIVPMTKNKVDLYRYFDYGATTDLATAALNNHKIMLTFWSDDVKQVLNKRVTSNNLTINNIYNCVLSRGEDRWGHYDGVQIPSGQTLLDLIEDRLIVRGWNASDAYLIISN